MLLHDSKAVCDLVAHAVLKRVKLLESKYSFFNQTSFLNQINNRQSNKIKLDSESYAILQETFKLMGATNFVFDIAYSGTLKNCYTYKTIDEMLSEIGKLAQFASSSQFLLKNRQIIFSNPYTKIDLGGIIKEYAVDESAKIIQKHKIKSALINFGGDIKTIGLKNGQKWKIGIKNPIKPEDDICVLEIEECAITTSGHYEKSYKIEDRSFSYILQKSGLESSYVQVSVIHEKAMTAGVFSTSLLIDEKTKLIQGMSLYIVDKNLKHDLV
ncbi:MAG: hypothetical protein RL154_796 [Pseudomonadota bacterium]|jgi:thiamine biosynthesis lipoprotein